MSLLSTLLFAVGPSVGKALLKVILKEYAVLGEVAPDLLDLLKDKANASHSDRQKAGQVTAIGQSIAARLHPLFAEAQLPDNERAALLREVVLTLDGASPNLLVDSRLNPERVEQALLRVHPNATVGLSDPATRLYHRMIHEASQALIGVAAELAGYASVRDATILQDNAKVVELVTTLLRQPDEASQRFEKKYREIIERELNKLEMFGVRRLKEALRRQPLSVAYVTAEVARSERTRGNEEDRKLLETLLDGAPHSLEEQRRTTSSPIDKVLTTERRIVVRGEPGSGKTTLLQWIAVTAAAQRCEGMLHLWNNTVPFFIRLRQVVDSGFPMPEAYVSQVAPHLGGSQPRHEWTHEQLENGRAVVLIDGVDELPEGKRESFLGHLQDLVRDYPNARYVITSRPTAVSKHVWPEWHEWIEEAGFVEVSIQPMNHEAIEHFIDQWHAAYAKGTTDVTERTDVEKAGPHLKQLLPQRSSLRQLASNPLLCAMICALHLDRRNNLPSERIKLYQECIDMLLEDRDIGRKIDTRDYPPIGSRQKLALLQDLSYRMLRNGESELAIDRVEKLFADMLPGLGTRAEDAPKVRAYFVQRSGLLREPVEGYLDFRHRTFQEFFTACELVEEGEVGMLVKQADDDQWHETIALAVGLLRRHEVDRLLRDLITPGASFARRTLALACLETAVNVDPDLEHDIFAAVQELLPPYRREYQRLIAAAGERAIPYLLPDRQPNIAAKECCIRTLALIGGEKALAAIESYKDVEHEVVQRALNAAWSSFDPGDYARRVLAGRVSVGISDPTLLPFLTLLPHLQQLDLSGTQVSDLSGLPLLPHLQQLDLMSTQVSDLSGLPLLPHLQLLNLSGTQVSDLSGLPLLPHLQQLDLSGTQVIDLSVLAQLPNLEVLYID